MRRIAFCGLTILLAASCGGKDSPSDVNPNDNGSMTARVDGAAFTAFTVGASHANGILAVTGIQVSPAQGITFAISATGTGTYLVGASSSVNAVYTAGNSSWGAFTNTGSGSVVLTTLTASRAAGTFTFTMVANPGTGATGTKSITQGAFDVRF